MTVTTTSMTEPLRPALPRPTAMKLAGTEYDRFLDLLRSLRPDDWQAATDCPGWDVRAVAAHLLGMVEMAASLREQTRQRRAAIKRGGLFIDALTGLQVEERAAMTPAQIVERFAARAPKAARARRRTPGFVRRRPMPVPHRVGNRDETWSLGYLIDIILTRDPWMHRIDIARAIGTTPELTAEHDGVLVGDVVAEWGARHGRPFDLRLTGPAGGHWSHGADGPAIEMDAAEFCRGLSGRGSAEGVLGVTVPF
jgi:uncharacterized protein (TIGR03083 family)